VRDDVSANTHKREGEVRDGVRRFEKVMPGALLQGLVTLAPSVAWATIGTLFNQGSTLASNIWIARLIGKTSFGEYVIVLSTVQATASLASLGLGYTTTRYLAEWRHRDTVRAGALLGLFSRLTWGAAVLAAVLLALGASGLAGSALKAPALGPSLLLAAASTVFSVRSGFLTGALSGLEGFKRLGTSGMIAGVAYLACTVGGAAIGGVRGGAIGLFASAAIQCAVLTFALAAERRRQELPRGVAVFKEERALLLRFAVPAALSGISTVPVLWAVQAFLARSPLGFGDLAIYAAGLNMLSMVMFAPTVLNGVAMAWINRTQVVEGETAYKSAIRTNIGVTLVTVTFALIGMALVGPFLLSLYGRDFRAGYLALVVLLAASIPEALTNALAQSLQTRERMWDAFLGINIPRDSVIVAVAFFLVPVYGAAGAAAAYLIGRVVAFGAMLYLVRGDFGLAAVRVAAQPSISLE
jgi:O-antigen/teichoic acid export membrane protein